MQSKTILIGILNKSGVSKVIRLFGSEHHRTVSSEDIEITTSQPDEYEDFTKYLQDNTAKVISVRMLDKDNEMDARQISALDTVVISSSGQDNEDEIGLPIATMVSQKKHNPSFAMDKTSQLRFILPSSAQLYIEPTIE